MGCTWSDTRGFFRFPPVLPEKNLQSVPFCAILYAVSETLRRKCPRTVISSSNRIPYFSRFVQRIIQISSDFSGIRRKASAEFHQERKSAVDNNRSPKEKRTRRDTMSAAERQSLGKGYPVRPDADTRNYRPVNSRPRADGGQIPDYMRRGEVPIRKNAASKSPPAQASRAGGDFDAAIPAIKPPAPRP